MHDLRILLFEVTQKCNMNCDHCGSSCDINGGELLSKRDIIEVLKDVKKNIGINVMINISGGEPLMRRDIFDIGMGITVLGFDWGMVTNGSLITPRVVKDMQKSGMKTVTISLDGLKRTHDSLRHAPGSFDKVINALKLLKKASFLDHLQVTFTANSRNVYEIEQLYGILSDIGIDSIRTSFIDSIGRANDNKKLLMNKEQMEWLINFANSRNAAKGLPVLWGCPHYLGNKLQGRKFECFTGIHAASILYNGDIFGCPNIPRKSNLIQGNVKRDKFSEVWENGFAYFRNRSKSSSCEGCKHWGKCKGDSVHTLQFSESGEDIPSFCFKNIFEHQTQQYLSEIRRKYKDFFILEIGPADDEREHGYFEEIYMEPKAYEDMVSYFHFGENHSVSMYEQQMGMIGFKADSTYVIKYVFPSCINRYSPMDAIFDCQTLKQALQETDAIKSCFYKSDDCNDYIGDGLKFLGFIHSHCTQQNLQYSIGDELMHKRMVKKFGDYIGILVYPKGELLGAYYGEENKQGILKIIMKPSSFYGKIEP